jgi:hypothetical protein
MHIIPGDENPESQDDDLEGKALEDERLNDESEQVEDSTGEHYS